MRILQANYHLLILCLQAFNLKVESVLTGEVLFFVNERRIFSYESNGNFLLVNNGTTAGFNYYFDIRRQKVLLQLAKSCERLAAKEDDARDL